MCIYNITTAERAKPIGKMWTTLGQAKRAAVRAAKRFGSASIVHFSKGTIATMDAEGHFVDLRVRT